MKREEAVFITVGGLTLLLVGLVWLFGAWALVGGGATLVAAALLAKVKE